MVVIYIEPLGAHGGNEYYNKGWCEAAVNEGYSVHVITSQLNKNLSNNLNNLFYHYFFTKCFGPRPKLFRGLKYLSAVFYSLLLAFRQNADLIHCHIYHFSILELFVIALFKMFGFSVIATIHDASSHDLDSSNNHIKNITIFNKFSNRFIVHTDFCKNVIESDFENIKDKIDVILPRDFDFSSKKVNVEESREHFDIPQSDFVILFFGHIKKSKGLNVLLEAISILVKDEPQNLKLLIAGRPWKITWSYYQGLIDGFGIENNIIKKIEFIPDEEVPLYFGASNVVILPYKKIYNSGVVQRAWGYNRPVIASNLPAIREVVEDNSTGLLFDPGNAEDLADKIKYLLTNPGSIDDFKKNVQKKIFNVYGVKSIGKHIKKSYSAVINPNSNRFS